MKTLIEKMMKVLEYEKNEAELHACLGVARIRDLSGCKKTVAIQTLTNVI